MNLCVNMFYKYVFPDVTIEFMWDPFSINMLSLMGQGNLCGIIFYKYVVPDGTNEFMWDHIL